MKPSPIENFPVNSIVSIVGVESFQRIKINRISDCGVTVSGECGYNVVISRQSPAIFAVQKSETENVESEESQFVNISTRAPRGSLTKLMDNIKLPGKEFTIKTLAEFNKIPIPYANKWAKENCLEVGKQKGNGKGRVATIFQAK